MPSWNRVFWGCLLGVTLARGLAFGQQKDSAQAPEEPKYPIDTVELIERQVIPNSRIIRDSFHLNVWRLQLKKGLWYSNNMDSYARGNGHQGLYFTGRLTDDETRDFSRQFSQLDLEKLPAEFEPAQDAVRKLPDGHHYVLKYGDRETVIKHVPVRLPGETVADNLKRAGPLVKEDQKAKYETFCQACQIASSFVDGKMAPKKKKKAK